MQSAAIPYRKTEDGSIEVLLITSRTQRRWIIPKGKIEDDMLPHQSAAKEAMEEAGVIGVIESASIAEYLQVRLTPDGAPQLIRIEAFLLAVSTELERWPEEHQRERRWLPLEQAIELVGDPSIRRVLRRFAARHL